MTRPTPEKPKPCPKHWWMFWSRPKAVPSTNGRYWFVLCCDGECDESAQFGQSTPEEAIAAWNRRAK